MEDEELVKMFNFTLKKRETILYFLIVIINGANIYWFRYWTKYMRKEEVKGGGVKNKFTKFSQPRAWISLKIASVTPQSK